MGRISAVRVGSISTVRVWMYFAYLANIPCFILSVDCATLSILFKVHRGCVQSAEVASSFHARQTKEHVKRFPGDRLCLKIPLRISKGNRGMVVFRSRTMRRYSRISMEASSEGYATTKESRDFQNFWQSGFHSRRSPSIFHHLAIAT